jgi:hypothetical protein
VFQTTAALTVGTPTIPGRVLLINGAQAKNVGADRSALPGVTSIDDAFLQSQALSRQHGESRKPLSSLG